MINILEKIIEESEKIGFKVKKISLSGDAYEAFQFQVESIVKKHTESIPFKVSVSAINELKGAEIVQSRSKEHHIMISFDDIEIFPDSALSEKSNEKVENESNTNEIIPDEPDESDKPSNDPEPEKLPESKTKKSVF